MTFADRTLDFYSKLEINNVLPENIGVMNPYKNAETQRVCAAFYHRFYNDNNQRHIIFGINPGRFGAGITGIPFTDPVQLEKACGITNSFDKKQELSSQFVYQLIDQTGGPEYFYRHYYLGAVSPLGFIKNGKNFNYYDDKALQEKLKPFIIKSIRSQIGLGIQTDKCFCFGNGKNYQSLQQLNHELKIFEEIVPLPHPRWIMQYRKKELSRFLQEILQKLQP